MRHPQTVDDQGPVEARSRAADGPRPEERTRASWWGIIDRYLRWRRGVRPARRFGQVFAVGTWAKISRQTLDAVHSFMHRAEIGKAPLDDPQVAFQCIEKIREEKAPRKVSVTAAPLAHEPPYEPGPETMEQAPVNPDRKSVRSTKISGTNRSREIRCAFDRVRKAFESRDRDPRHKTVFRLARKKVRGCLLTIDEIADRAGCSRYVVEKVLAEAKRLLLRDLEPAEVERLIVNRKPGRPARGRS